MIKKIIRVYESVFDGSFRERLRLNILTWLGIERHEEEIRTLHYFLTLFHEASSAPPTNDKELRILQKCDAILLSVFDKICTKYSLTYWLDYGTLLGAYRHKGFIPWDNDTDVVMPRKDYDRLKEEAKSEIESLGISFEDFNGRYVIGFRKSETGIFTDIFCMEECYINNTGQSGYNQVKAMRDILKNKINGLLKFDYMKYCECRDSVFCCKDGEAKFFYHAISPGAESDVYALEDIYPLSNMSFEGFDLKVPALTSKCLELCYGPNYMQLPKTGPESHTSEIVPLKKLANINSINMEEILSELCFINNKMKGIS